MKNEHKAPRTVSRIIAVEEHFATKAFLEGPGHWLRKREDADQLIDRLCDLGEIRLNDMDAAGIDIQVLSLNAPGVEQLQPDKAVEMARESNEILAEAVKRYPLRFAGFASLATPSPEKAADELERMVQDYGFKGGVINGHSQGRYMDDEFFWPVLEKAESLNVPLQIHPSRPPQALIDTSYTGNFSTEIARRLSLFAWGWHIETAIHILRLILSGVFDRFPNLQIIVGHLGEGLSFMLPRIDQKLPKEATRLKKSIKDYFNSNLYFAVSGFNYLPPFLNLLHEVGTERILFSVDYPHGSISQACDFLERIPVSPVDREKIAHGNGELLLGL